MATPHPLGNWYLNEKGYPRFSSGKYRGQYVHRVVKARKLRRKLAKDEDVHHRDGDKLNFKDSNLQVLSHKEHGWVSAKQHWYMKRKEERDRREWDSYMNEHGGGECQTEAYA